MPALLDQLRRVAIQRGLSSVSEPPRMTSRIVAASRLESAFETRAIAQRGEHPPPRWRTDDDDQEDPALRILFDVNAVIAIAWPNML